MGTDYLVDFVKDFNFEYLSRVEAQDNDRRHWRRELLALDKARETWIAQKDNEVTSMDKKLFELEVERTKNMGNMTTALLMLASSMDALTRCFVQPYTMQSLCMFKFSAFSNASPWVPHCKHALGNPISLP